jgi:acetolactate synthase-1/2/3 large subunit
MADVFLHYLRAEGARVVFGVPGGLLHPFFSAVERDPAFRLIVARHECGAAFMADGFARVGGPLAVCAGTSGPGATNLLTGVAVAYSDGVPMLVVTGQAPSHALGKGAAQETPPEDIDIVAMFKPITKYSTMIPGPARLAHHLRRALRLALTGRPGPVHLNVPVDFWDRPAVEDWFEPATYRPAYELFDRRAVNAASRRLIGARHPVILVGSGAATASAAEHVRSLAELLPARVATTPRAKGVFPEDHPLSLGVMGIAGHAAARNVLLSDEVDVLLTVGASLNETTTLNWHPNFRPSEALIQIDISADRIARNYPDDVATRRPSRSSSSITSIACSATARPRRRCGGRPPRSTTATPSTTPPNCGSRRRGRSRRSGGGSSSASTCPPTRSCSPTSAGTCSSTSTISASATGSSSC